MYLHALSLAVPEARYTQADCWEMFSRSAARERLSRRSQILARAILTGDSGIQTRHFAAPHLERIFDCTPDELNEIFRREAPRLAGRALTGALEQAGLRSGDVDALLISTCTGYLCPGLTSYVAEQLGLRRDAFLQDLVGLGCGAAIPTLRAASAIVREQPQAVVACLSVEVCSAAFYLDDDPGVLISACLFSDGAAATIWRGTPGPHALACDTFRTWHEPELRDQLRFEQRNGKLRNLLAPTVPQVAAGAVQRLFAAETSNGHRPLARILAHPGGRDVISAIEAALPERRLDDTRDTLRHFGNMSSPTVLFALDHALHETRPAAEADWWLVSFGAGFAAHSCRFGVRTT
ncbi:MAG TPA: stilbene synthase [Opitutaceae bacterium]